MRMHWCRDGVFVLVALLLSGMAPARAEDVQFPFNQELLMDTPPMRPNKRIPGITVTSSGAAQIDLWCRSVFGRVELSAGSIAITMAPLPETAPAMMSPGQCTPERMRADETMLASLTQATAWRKRGTAIEIIGPATMRFWPSTH